MKKKILIVDDDDGVIMSVRFGLQDLTDDYEIDSASNGKDCLDYLENNTIPDLILLDIMMPKMNGWDTAAKIKKNDKWKEIPLIFLTAKTDSFSQNFGGMESSDYITKPFDIKDLYQRIRAAMI